MNTNRPLPQVLIIGAALIASALACSVQAADATLSFTGVITPATNSVKAAAESKESTLASTKENTKETSMNKGDVHATR